MAARASCALERFPPTRPTSHPHTLASPRHPGSLAPRRAAGPEQLCGLQATGGGRLFVAAAVSCPDATAVETGGPVCAGHGQPLRASARAGHSGAGLRPPLPPSVPLHLSSLLAQMGPGFCTPKKKKEPIDPLRRLQSTGSEPACALALQ